MGELLRHSDTAMYQAKDRGRNNFQLFSPVMERKLKERIAIESSLRTALSVAAARRALPADRRHRVASGRGTRGAAALEASSHGFVPPARFIAVAEETGLIVPIGEFVLERAIKDAARWRQGGGRRVPIAVNISAVQLQRSTLAAHDLALTRTRP